MKNNESSLAPLGFLLAWVSETATKTYADALAEVGMTPHHVGVLSLLASQLPMKQARIAEALAIFKPEVVPLVNDLEVWGYVERRPHPTDRRAVEVHILQAGRDHLTGIETLSQEVADRFFAPLTQQEFADLHTSLMKLYQHHGGEE